MALKRLHRLSRTELIENRIIVDFIIGITRTFWGCLNHRNDRCWATSTIVSPTRSIVDDCRLTSVPLVSRISEPTPDSKLRRQDGRTVMKEKGFYLFSLMYEFDVCNVGEDFAVDMYRGIERITLQIRWNGFLLLHLKSFTWERFPTLYSNGQFFVLGFVLVLVDTF